MSLDSLSAWLQKIPLVRGKTRLGRYLMRKYLPLRDVQIRSHFGHRYVVPHLSESVAYQIAINGQHEPRTLEALRRLLPKGGTFVDVGANMGFFAITLASSDPASHVIAVEGSPRIVRYTERNIALNNVPNLTLIHRALTDSDDQVVTFYEAPLGQFGRGSLSNTEWKDRAETQTLTLDRLVKQQDLLRVDVIKLDIEGAEAFAFRGGRELLSSPDAPSLVFEFNGWAEQNTAGVKIGDAQRLLLEYGYTLWSLEGWLRGHPPLTQICESGFQNLVARKLPR